MSLALAGRVRSGITEELDAVGSVGVGGKRSGDERNSARSCRRRDVGEVLEQVRSGVAAGVVEGDTVASPIDAEGGIGVDRVPEDKVGFFRRIK